MSANEILRKKRFGEELSEKEIKSFVAGVTDGSWADYQISAMLMAICINGMSDRETLALTVSMANSGERLDLSAIEGVKADKHSTGGVGDTTSLILVPLVAACGVNMAKMSGRGLGFTGGTLDKLESIPGFNVNKTIPEFIDIVKRTGCAIIGQSPELAPADKVLYALRDVTETVDCMPLMISSILSKKLATGCDVVTLDVKTGNGALLTELSDSTKFARDMVRIGKMSGKRFSALITDMSQPLGMYIGNALEVEEAIDVLAGRSSGALKEVSLLLGAQILKSARVAASVKDGLKMLNSNLDNGSGLKRFADMIEAEDGDPRVVYDTSLLPKASTLHNYCSKNAGYIMSVNAAMIGEAARRLGAGRLKKTDIIDPAVGIVMNKRIGDHVDVGEPICTLHLNDGSDKLAALDMLSAAFKLSGEPVSPPPLLHDVVE